MKAQHLIELVLEETEGLDPSLALVYLNEAQREFCQLTRMLRKRSNFTTASKDFRHEFSTITDLETIREIWKDGKKLDNTQLPTYLQNDGGFWFVESNSPVTVYLGWFDGSSEQKFESGETFDVLYYALPTPIADDGLGNEDFDAIPEIPERFHSALAYRANEKAARRDPETRRYWHALWQDQLVKGKRYANEMNSDGEWNVKIYTI